MRVISLFVVVLIIVFAGSYGLAQLFGYGDNWIQAEIDALSAPVAALAIFALVTSDIVLPTPSSVLFVLAGEKLGVLVGAGVTSSGALLGSVIGFAIGRRGGRAALSRFASPAEIERSTGWLDRYGTIAIVVGRAAPMASEVLSILAGVSTMSWPRFLTASVLGTVPLAVVSAWAGDRQSETPALGVFFAFVLPGIVWILLAIGLRLGRKSRPGVAADDEGR